MDFVSCLFYLAPAIAFISLLIIKILRGHPSSLNLPPGPKAWPIIGNLNLMGSLPHRSMHELSKTYGPLLHLRLGTFPVIIGSSAEMAREILRIHDVNFASRPRAASGKYNGYNYSDIFWSSYGTYWRQARKICTMELFSPKQVRSIEYIRVEEIHALLHHLFATSSSGMAEINLKENLFIVGLNLISRVVFGKKYTEQSGNEKPIMTPKEFKSMVEELLLMGQAFNIGDFIPWLDFLDLQGYVKRMKALGKKLDQFLEHVIDDHNLKPGGEKDYVAKDMIAVLLQLADDPDLEIKLDRTSVKAFALDMIAGGTDTSIVLVEWAISEMLKKPHVLEKAVEELDRVIGKDRWVEEKDEGNLPYIEAIMKETMRLHPVAPLLTPRFSREDATINGYHIPAGSRIIVNAWAIGRDPKVWDKPNEFIPERLMGRAINITGQNFDLIPFGSGRRMCPAYNLGLRVLHLMLANLLHGFKWKLPEKIKPEDLNMEELFGLAMSKKYPLTTVIEPRLPRNMYNLLST